MKTTIATTRLTASGHITLSNEIREKLGLVSGTQFVIFISGDSLILKKIVTPDENEIKEKLTVLRDARKFARESGLKKEDVQKNLRQIRAGKK